MQFSNKIATWWGPPKKFDTHFKERKISWLELFYDLVYVIAISRITHHFGEHLSLINFLEFAGYFILIFWGWLNGSLYHDLHGNAGLRTRLMTLWQVMIIAAVTITISQPEEKVFHYSVIAFMVMQIYITYLWWSVGFYDKTHRRYNLPYTILYLTSFALLFISLYVPHAIAQFVFIPVIIFNYAPPFVASILLRSASLELSLSSSMAERLGLFTIIVMGEVVLGVVNGISAAPDLSAHTWFEFALSLTIVFTLWWLFFTLISDREAKPGFVTASILEMLYLPTLMALGLLAVSFTHFFAAAEDAHAVSVPVPALFMMGIAIFLSGIALMIGLIVYPDVVKPMKKGVRLSLFITALVFVIFALLNLHIDTVYMLLIVLMILLAEIYFLNSLYYTLGIAETREPEKTIE